MTIQKNHRQMGSSYWSLIHQVQLDVNRFEEVETQQVGFFHEELYVIMKPSARCKVRLLLYTPLLPCKPSEGGIPFFSVHEYNAFNDAGT